MTEVNCYTVGIMETNCYFIADKASGALALIDPGEYTDVLYDAVMEKGGDLRLILLTHGHFDHIGGVSEFIKKFPTVKVYIGSKDAVCLSDDNYNLSAKVFNRKFPHFDALFLNDGDAVYLGETRIKYIETPGHTAGSGCFIFDGSIISGDTLFCESCGRTDFINSSPGDMINSLDKLAEIQGEYRVYPGHGSFSTLSHEKKYNPYMSARYEDIY